MCCVCCVCLCVLILVHALRIAGSYGLNVPYFNGIFSGKVARFNLFDLDNVQEVDLTVDRQAPDTLKGGKRLGS